jgi:hypothetical protein
MAEAKARIADHTAHVEPDVRQREHRHSVAGVGVIPEVVEIPQMRDYTGDRGNRGRHQQTGADEVIEVVKQPFQDIPLLAPHTIYHVVTRAKSRILDFARQVTSDDP